MYVTNASVREKLYCAEPISDRLKRRARARGFISIRAFAFGKIFAPGKKEERESARISANIVNTRGEALFMANKWGTKCNSFERSSLSLSVLLRATARIIYFLQCLFKIICKCLWKLA